MNDNDEIPFGKPVEAEGPESGVNLATIDYELLAATVVETLGTIVSSDKWEKGTRAVLVIRQQLIDALQAFRDKLDRIVRAQRASEAQERGGP